MQSKKKTPAHYQQKNQSTPPTHDTQIMYTYERATTVSAFLWWGKSNWFAEEETEPETLVSHFSLHCGMQGFEHIFGA